MEKESKRSFIARTEQEKLNLIEQWERSGLPIKTFCSEHNFSDSLFHSWLNKYRRNKKPVKKQQEFIPLQVTSIPACSQANLLYAEVITVKGDHLKLYQSVSSNYLRTLLS